ncbi:zinc finger MYM-type 1-like [Paramuricea clavata]|uniref:Zinc finger MYM-type 1-like n=1 Tax=Paramuricea clavata TaxID=317549 RepID=A0A7D9IZ55_PARCT|nr:zinc finger MYM-type 1-like [Paramuricea clavata]
MIEEFFTTLQELYNFLTKSTGRFGKLKSKIESLQEGLIMKNLSQTRWIGRAESIKAVWFSYETVIGTLHDIHECDETDHDAKKTAKNLLDKLKSFEFYVSLLFMKNVLYKAKIVVMEMQEIEQDILASVEVLQQTRNEMLRMREDDVAMEGIISAATGKCESYGINVEYEFSKRHRPRRASARFDENFANATVPSFSQHYRKEMFKVLDRLVSDINEIDEYLSDIVLPIIILLPTNLPNCSKQEVENLCAAFPQDFKDPDAMCAEIKLISSDIEKSGAKNLKEAAKCVLGKQQFYPNLTKAYQLALTIPVSVASNERSFSKLKLVKSYLRSTMKENRLDDLMILSSSVDILDELELDKVANSWSLYKSRMIKI